MLVETWTGKVKQIIMNEISNVKHVGELTRADNDTVKQAVP